MNDRTRAHGYAANAVLRYLYGRDVPDVALRKPLDCALGAEPHGQEAIEMEIALVLAAVVAEQIHLGAPATHLAVDRPDVQRALQLAGRLGDSDPVDYLETIYEDLCACLKSPLIKNAIETLGSALLRSPGGRMSAAAAVRTIIFALAETPADAADQEAHPRTIYVR